MYSAAFFSRLASSRNLPRPILHLRHSKPRHLSFPWSWSLQRKRLSVANFLASVRCWDMSHASPAVLRFLPADAMVQLTAYPPALRHFSPATPDTVAHGWPSSPSPSCSSNSCKVSCFVLRSSSNRTKQRMKPSASCWRWLTTGSRLFFLALTKDG
jgi:hypothetical protein